MSEYLNDNSISHSERAVNSRQESLWELVNDLIEGLDRLIACYPNGLERIEGIYRQEVLKIESRNTKDNLPDTTKPQSKQKKHRTTKEEMEILSVLKVYKDKLPDDAIASVCEQLSEIWTKKKIKDWWNYHKDK
ncbi:hypothetical protein GLOIN_2v1482460 [Rhizophagus clarus]|uniref:Uncharacterized protein n=1 Tax=Rhizophagus clarus TaxID=94130 RepID=A0A8H3LMX9_9GLOM|nr:hypothetical protein GLOIN_2v1482460 [Rhizophagus clarus]